MVSILESVSPVKCEPYPTKGVMILVNSDILSGMWKQVRGEIRQTWGELTDDEIDQIAGKRDKLVGKLQEKYGYSKMEAEAEIDEFLESVQARL
jgi:uncharacterized protein YjbJ (UPF0337 family)